MYRSTLIFLFVIVVSANTLAQETRHAWEVYGGYSWAHGDDNYPGSKFQLINPPNLTANPFPSRRAPRMHGVAASVTYNFSRYVGAQFEFATHTEGVKPAALPLLFPQGGCPGCFNIEGGFATPAKARASSYMGGVQIKDNETGGRVKPFGHVLFGVASQSLTYTELAQRERDLFFKGKDRVTTNSFAMTLGGGIDVRVSKRIDIRVIQFDYVPVFTKTTELIANGQSIVQNGFTFLIYPGVTTTGQRQNMFRIGAGVVFH
jgi:opacity protein-like surface antigen